VIIDAANGGGHGHPWIRTSGSTYQALAAQGLQASLQTSCLAPWGVHSPVHPAGIGIPSHIYAPGAYKTAPVQCPKMRDREFEQISLLILHYDVFFSRSLLYQYRFDRILEPPENLINNGRLILCQFKGPTDSAKDVCFADPYPVCQYLATDIAFKAHFSASQFRQPSPWMPLQFLHIERP
jgi:hypothetical protein